MIAVSVYEKKSRFRIMGTSGNLGKGNEMNVPYF